MPPSRYIGLKIAKLRFNLLAQVGGLADLATLRCAATG